MPINESVLAIVVVLRPCADGNVRIAVRVRIVLRSFFVTVPTRLLSTYFGGIGHYASRRVGGDLEKRERECVQGEKKALRLLLSMFLFSEP